jgi:two-component system response regulator HydG
MIEFHGLFATSELMCRVFERVRTFAPALDPVLLTGESGTGKEGLAEALHAESGRTGPLVPLNCGALPSGLADSELFGHIRGAFTGAVEKKRGAFGAADGGTLFLDEIGELPLELQPRLLRVIETGVVRPVGSDRELEVDVRVVAATHRVLPELVRCGRFRRDLFHRLSVLPIEVPPLRERPEDIPGLARRFAGPGVEFDLDAVDHLQQLPWYGNVRELRNTVVRSRLLAKSGRLTRSNLVPDETEPGPLDNGSLRDLERARILDALHRTGGNRARAARMLGLPKSTLGDRLRRLGA